MKHILVILVALKGALADWQKDVDQGGGPK